MWRQQSFVPRRIVASLLAMTGTEQRLMMAGFTRH
jgi:hypothetical protein